MAPPPTAVLVNPLTGQPMPQQTAFTGPEVIAIIGKQVQCETAGGPIIVRTPVGPPAGAVFGVVDAGGVASTNNITINPDDPIDGSAAPLVLNTDNANAVFVFENGQWRRLEALRKMVNVEPPASELVSFVADNPGGGGGGGGSSFVAAEVIFRPGTPSSGNAVATWAEVETQIAAAAGNITVIIDDSFAPAVVPASANTQCFHRVTISGFEFLPPPQLTIADGGRLRNIARNELVQIIATPTAVSPLFFDGPAGGILCGPGGAFALLVGSLVPFIDMQSDFFVLALFNGSAANNDNAPTIPMVQMKPTSGMFLAVISSVNPPISATCVRGDATTTLTYAHDASGLDTIQTLFAGTFNEDRTSFAASCVPSSGNTAGRPTNAQTGQFYYDTDLPAVIVWNGAAWDVLASGGAAALIFDTVGAGVNVRIPRTGLASAIDNTKQGITNLGADSSGVALGATNDFATIGGGDACFATGAYSTVGGGNTCSAEAANTVCAGGLTNHATGPNSAIGGGANNTTSGGAHGTIGGGNNNACVGGESTISGGANNTTSANQATIAGGSTNNATAPGATVSGGETNTASGSHATVAGGNVCVASGDFSAVTGGLSCTASGEEATCGGNACGAGKQSVAFGDTCTADPAAGTGAVALGTNCSTLGLGAVALGNLATALFDRAVAIGNGATAAGVDHLALGSAPTVYQFYGANPGAGQAAAIPDAAGGVVVDVEARAALNALLAFLRARGDVAP